MESVVQQLLFCAPPFCDVAGQNLNRRFARVGDRGQDRFNIPHLAIQPHELLGFETRLLVPFQVPLTREEIDLLYNLAEIFVNPCAYEGCPNTVLQAMACGRPVVAARAGAVPELVDESVGQLAKPADGASMAEAIAALYERDLNAVGATARARVLNRFTWTQAFNTQVTTYTSLVSTRRLPVSNEQSVIELESPTS